MILIKMAILIVAIKAVRRPFLCVIKKGKYGRAEDFAQIGTFSGHARGKLPEGAVVRIQVVGTDKLSEYCKCKKKVVG